MKILIADDMAPQCVDIFKKAQGCEVDVKTGLKPADLKAIIGEYDALAVRSATKVTAEIIEAGKKLKVIGRAGIGVDNIDLNAASRRGIVVMNTPGGSSVTVAELALALMLSLARHVPQATASLKAGKWEKKKFEGHELFNKTLGVVGIGNIGAVLVERALGMKMKVVAYDPFISAEAARALGAELVTLDELLARADVVSFHLPLTDQTRHMLNAASIAKMKKGAFIINCARGGIVDEAALAQALESGHLGGAGFDVFEKEPVDPENPLLKLPNFVCTPHLGASTEEAQLNVAISLAEQMIDYLVNGNVRNAVNAPSVSKETLEKMGPLVALAYKLGLFAGQMAPEKVDLVEVTYSGELVEQPVRVLTPQILRGLLSCFDLAANEVSAPVIAKERGFQVVERRESVSPDYTSLVSVKVRGAGGEFVISGTVTRSREPRVVRINEFPIEAALSGTLVITRSVDVPGVIGRLGTTLGEAKVNIAQIAVARTAKEALSLLNVDDKVPADVLSGLRTIPNMLDVRQVSIP